MVQHFRTICRPWESSAVPVFPKTFSEQFVMPSPNMTRFVSLIFIFLGFQYRSAKQV